MNFVENNGKKVAAILCVASAFPVVATIYAQGTAPGWHGDAYIKQDRKVAKGWTKIGDKSYYFNEDGKLDQTKSYNASAAVASTKVKDDVKATVAAKVQEKVNEQDASANTEAVPSVNEVSEATGEPAAQADAATETVDTAAAADTDALEVQNVAEDNAVAQDTNVAVTDQTIIETAESDSTGVNVEEVKAVESDSTQEVQTAAAKQNVTVNVADADTNTAPAQSQNNTAAQQAPAQQNTAAAQDNNAAQQQTTAEQQNAAPAQQTNTAQPAAPAETQQTSTSADTSQYADLNARIAAAALAEVGTTDGEQCTEVATGALNAAGVSASVVWPWQYVQYGYYVSADQAQAGNLIYYANGGSGYAHIAVYVGNGQAVQGNYNGKTVLTTADLSQFGGSEAQYIQITG